MKRSLRSSKIAEESLTASSSSITPLAELLSSPMSFTEPTLPLNEVVELHIPGSKLPNISAKDLTLLRRKQSKLALAATSIVSSLSSPHSETALKSTLIFAQHEAGTAVCISASGWLLTCAHCFGDDEEEYRSSCKQRWLLFYTGLAVRAECRVWDQKRDLALLRIVAVETTPPLSSHVPNFSFIQPGREVLKPGAKLCCVGQPGRDDLESKGNKKTKFDLVEVSEGRFRGMVEGDLQDNSEIGSLMHDCWTYWGHSGAPLVDMKSGGLVGLHSSWDDKTAMRHGIPLVAIMNFFKGCEKLMGADAVSSS